MRNNIKNIIKKNVMIESANDDVGVSEFVIYLYDDILIICNKEVSLYDLKN